MLTKKNIFYSAAALILVFSMICACFAYEDPKEAELLSMAGKAYADGFYEVSLSMLERFRKNYPDSPEASQALLLSGQCYFYQGRYLDALNIFEGLMDDPQSSVIKDAVYFWLGEVHFKGGNFEKSAQLYQKLIGSYPQSTFAPAAYYSLGWSLAELGKYGQSSQVFKSLLEKYPNTAQSKDAIFKLVECLYNLKEYAQLKETIKPAFKLYTGDSARLAYLYFYLAESEYYSDRFEEATKNYLKAAQFSGEPQVQALAKLGLGWSYLKLLKYNEAEDLLLQIKPESLDKKSLEVFLLGRAVLMSQTSRFYEAKKLYEQLGQASADPLILIQAELGRADAFFNLAEYAQSINLYKEILEKTKKPEFKDSLPPELVERAHYNLGLAYIKAGKPDAGMEVFNAATSSPSGRTAQVDLLFQAGQAYEEADELLKAQDAYFEVLKLYPDSPFADYAQYQLACVQLKRKDLPAAFESLRAMPKKYPQSKLLPDAAYALGSAYFGQGNYAQASEVFIRFKDEFKDSQFSPRALYMLGVSYISLGKVNDALIIFKSLSRLDPIALDLKEKVEYEIADCYYKLGQENEALSRFKLLRTKYPDSQLTPDILWWLGQYYYRNKDLVLSRRYFDALTKDYPQHALAPQAHYALGVAFGQESNFEQAQEHFKLAIKTGSPQIKSQAQAALAETYTLAGNPDEAAAQYNQMIKESSGQINPDFTQLAQAYYKLGNYPEAKKYYLRALETPGTAARSAALRFSLAEVFEAASETDAAIQQYLSSAELFAQDKRLLARSLLRAAKLYEDKDNYKEALQIYRKVIEKSPSTAESSFAQERVEWIKTNTR